MRVNVYAEEMTDRIEIISKEIDGARFTGLRIYLELPATVPCAACAYGTTPQEKALCLECKGTQSLSYRGPFLHRPGDDDSSAVTFWGKRDLREILRIALALLDEHYDGKEPPCAR